MTARRTRKRLKVLAISDEIALQRLIRAALHSAQPGHFAVEPIRRQFPSAQVIILSEAYRESDAIAAIDTGVECLGRPFRESELVSRVRAAALKILSARGFPRRYIIGSASYDALEGRVSIDGATVELSDAEATALTRFMRAEGKVVTFAELTDALGRRDDALGRQRVRSVIWALRRKLGRGLRPSPVESEPRVGYRISQRAPSQLESDQSSEQTRLEVHDDPRLA
jgi:DNA-binding response OmpR family regulator